jgi:glycerol-3-phosphate cytidylyltransferase
MIKYTTGYIAGVFDLFHIGHLNILKKAKDNCQYLIVGINTDELVRQYKGKTPIIPYRERAAIVEAIRYVDKVVPIDNRDKVLAYNKLDFNILFAGDDWKGSRHYKDMEKKLSKFGVKIIYLPYTKGTSSTLLTSVLNDTIKSLLSDQGQTCGRQELD